MKPLIPYLQFVSKLSSVMLNVCLSINSRHFILRPSILKTDDRGIQNAFKTLDSRLRGNDDYLGKQQFMHRL